MTTGVDGGSNGADGVGQGNFVVISRRQYDPARRGELEHLLAGVIRHDVEEEPETLVQAFHFEEPNWFWSYEVFTSREAYIAHRDWHDAEPWWPQVLEILGGFKSDLPREGGRHFCVGTVAKGVRFPPYSGAAGGVVNA